VSATDKKIDAPTKKEAAAVLDQGHKRICTLVDKLSPSAATKRATIGGGEWSAKDLLGHLTSWQEHAMEALSAWERGDPAPVDAALKSKRGVDALNAKTFMQKAAMTWTDVRDQYDEVHGTLVKRLKKIADDVWNAPPSSGGATSLGERIGGILGGPTGPFAHDDAHLDDLRSYVEEATRNS
jgi:hypothetical protein